VGRRLGKWFNDTVELFAQFYGWKFALVLGTFSLLVAVAIGVILRVNVFVEWTVVVLAIGLFWVAAAERRRLRERVLEHVDEVDDLRSRNFLEFEAIVAQVLRGEGKLVYDRGGLTRDEGIDLIAEAAGRRWLIQCKHWPSRLVDVNVVRALGGVVAAKKAFGGVLVTSGKFSSPAREEAHRYRIRLIDGEELVRRRQELKLRT
jgi:HJR/Mrr/RecB family endonuclease